MHRAIALWLICISIGICQSIQPPPEAPDLDRPCDDCVPTSSRWIGKMMDRITADAMVKKQLNKQIEDKQAEIDADEKVIDGLKAQLRLKT